ncbi:unnamed protein product, partial [Adineta steineri]
YGSISIERIHSSLRSVIEQHTILRTAVYFDQANNQIEQCIQPLTDEIYSFQHSQGISTSEQLDDLLTNESTKKYFDVTKGKVLRCHVVERSTENHDHSLHEGDFIFFNVHHIAFDLSSVKPFLKAFAQACYTDDSCQPILSVPQYIDFALYEQAMLSDINVNSKMNKAQRFWSDLMHDYDWNGIRRLVPEEDTNDKVRSGRALSVAFHLEQNIVDAMMLFTSSNNITMFSLSLACYYAFLYKIINDDDLCVAGVIANRSKEEMKNMIGMFVNLVPYRIKMQSNNSFNHFVQEVQQLCIDVLEHASLPYQQIIETQGKREHHVLPSSAFQYESSVSTLTQNTSSKLIVGEGCVLGAFNDRDTAHGNGTTLFDLALTIAHDHHSRSTEYFLDCSTDIFKSQANVDLLANRFQHMLTQLFSSSSIIHEPIYKLSIVLPTEQEFIHQMNNTDISTSYSWPNTVHECFVQQAQLYPQKLALELDEQSLTYSELLYSVYCLTNYLTDKIQPNEIICQCVERSFEMIIGMLAILSSGAVYCPLSPLDPPERLKTLIEDTSAKTLLIHSFTWQTILMTHTSCNLIITDSFIMFNHINYNNDHHITKPISVTSDNIAYIIFTSGTTGIPKAVVISHSHLLLYLQSSVEV